MPKHVRKGDLVMVRSGRYRNQQGTILRVIPERDQVIVQGINVKKKHVRPNQSNPQGGIIEKEMPLHISNVSPLADGKPTRVRFLKKPDGSKIRMAARNGEQLGPELKKAR